MALSMAVQSVLTVQPPPQLAADRGDLAFQEKRHQPVCVTLRPYSANQTGQVVLGLVSDISDEIEEFRGIPYGTVPGRWQHSRPLSRLPRDVFDATTHGPRCPQPQEPNNTRTFQSYLEFPSIGGESEFNCLNLFITRPSSRALVRKNLHAQQNNLPVYFYIHGGAYAFGAGTDPMWNPSRLVSRALSLGKPFIAVTINYRLHLFGFAASSEIMHSQLENGEIQGCNFGLGDQWTALQWVSGNIASFGGDPDNIIIGGQSAGACSVHAHVVGARHSPRKALFRGAIIQSGAMGTLGPITLAQADARWGNLRTSMGMSSDWRLPDAGSLGTVSAADLVRAASNIQWMAFPLVEDGLTIHPRSNGHWYVTLDHREVTVINHNVQKAKCLRILIGDTDVEASIHHEQIAHLQTSDQIYDIFEPTIESTLARDELFQAYGIGSSLPSPVLRERLTRLFSDIEFGLPVHRARKDLSENNRTICSDITAQETSRTHCVVPNVVRSYRVSFGNPFRGFSHNIAHHCVDLIYIYDCFHDALAVADRRTPANNVVASNLDLVDVVQRFWIDFITNHNDGELEGEIDRCWATVFGADRRARLVKMDTDPEWVERSRRFDVLSKYWSARMARLF